MTSVRICGTCIALMLLLVVLLQHANAAGWPTYRYDVLRGGVSSEKIKLPLSPNWIYQSQTAPRPAWPEPAEELPRAHLDNAFHAVVDEGSVYFGSSIDNNVYAIDAFSGETRWTFTTEGPVRYAPSLYNGKIYFGSDDGYVYCLRTDSGELLWKYRAGPFGDKVIGNGRMISLWPVRTSVLAVDGCVYFGAGVFPYEGIFICALNANDGSVVWKNDTIGDRAHELRFGGISPQSYLALSADTLYVPSARSLPVAFDRATGKFLYYCAPVGKHGGAWALVDDDTLIAGIDKSGSPQKIAYNAKTGKSKGAAFSWFPAVDLAITKDFSYILGVEGIIAVDRKQYKTASKQYNTSVSKRKKLRQQLSDLRNRLKQAKANEKSKLRQQVEATTRKISDMSAKEKEMKATPKKWECSARNMICLIRAGQVIFAGGKEKVVAVDVNSGEELWKAHVEGNAVGLACAGGRLVVSTDKGFVYCFGGKKSSPVRIVKTNLSRNPYSSSGNELSKTARMLVDSARSNKGYCLLDNCGDGQLAYELVKCSEMNIIALERDAIKREAACAALAKAGMLGTRVVVEDWQLYDLPDYFANLVVSQRKMYTAEEETELARVLQPYGGVRMTETVDGTWQRNKRGELEGADNWTHLYGGAGNTGSSNDELVKGPLGVLWFGEPGSRRMVERHGRSSSPLVINGRMFLEGENIIMAYDAYNGSKLWEREIPGAVRVRVDADSSNVAADMKSVFVATRDRCYRLDQASGEVLHVYPLPPSEDGKQRRWGHLACVNGTLLGTAAFPLDREYAELWKNFVDENGNWKPAEEIEFGTYTKWGRDNKYNVKDEYIKYTRRYPKPCEEAWQGFQRDSLKWFPMDTYTEWFFEADPENCLSHKIKVGDALFAYDAKTGNPKWHFKAESIANIAIAVGDGKVFLAAGITRKEDKEQAFATRKELTKSGVYVEGTEKKLSNDKRDCRMVIALDLNTGKRVWEQSLDLTGCGGDRMGVAYQQGKLLLFGQFSNHDERKWGAGRLSWRRIIALDGASGAMQWSKPLNYRRRPTIIGDKIVIEPRMCDLHTGNIHMREHPITGQSVPWEYLRPGHSCGITTAAPNYIFYRSWCGAMVDTSSDGGVEMFGAIRPGCWLNLVPASGILNFPEASSGCTCSFPLRCSMALAPKKRKKTGYWSVFVTPEGGGDAKHLHVNLGAPGDKRDAQGRLWFGYPRPQTKKAYRSYTYGVQFDLAEIVEPGMGYYCTDHRGLDVKGTKRDWLFTSGCKGLTSCELPLQGKKSLGKPAQYTVRIGFMAPKGDIAGLRVFDIKLQGRVVEKDFDIVKAAGGANIAVVREWKNIDVNGKLKLELVPSNGSAPVANFIEAVRVEQVSSSNTLKLGAIAEAQ
jgi:outer membrane protein assembly factor BamB